MVHRVQGVQIQVANWLNEHIGLQFTGEDIFNDLHQPGQARSSFTGALNRLREKGWDIQNPAGKGSYLFTGRRTTDPVVEEKSMPTLYEFVGRTPGGVVLLRDEEGNLYRAEPLDL